MVERSPAAARATVTPSPTREKHKCLRPHTARRPYAGAAAHLVLPRGPHQHRRHGRAVPEVVVRVLRTHVPLEARRRHPVDGARLAPHLLWHARLALEHGVEAVAVRPRLPHVEPRRVVHVVLPPHLLRRAEVARLLGLQVSLGAGMKLERRVRQHVHAAGGVRAPNPPGVAHTWPRYHDLVVWFPRLSQLEVLRELFRHRAASRAPAWHRAAGLTEILQSLYTRIRCTDRTLRNVGDGDGYVPVRENGVL
eukprot:5324249-Prymnesium_polylepis.1